MEKRWQSPVMKRLVRNSSLTQAVISFGMDKHLPSFVLQTCTLTVREIQTDGCVLDLEPKREKSTCSVSLTAQPLITHISLCPQ